MIHTDGRPTIANAEPRFGPAYHGRDEIDIAAETAQPLFRLNQWTWRDEKTPPTLLDLRATLSSLAWELRRTYGWDGDGSTHRASTGRLIVVMGGTGDITYGVELA